MARDSRTMRQVDFDLTKHGWAFCDKHLLQGKLERLRELIKYLHATDERHEILRVIEEAYTTKMKTGS